MKKMWMLAAVALSAGAAMAQTTTVMTTNATTACPPVACTTCATTLSSVRAASAAYPDPCAAKLTRDTNGRPILLVLGSEERYAFDYLHTKGSAMNWNDVSCTASSFFSPTNPLLNSRPNPVILRHGNPYYPYYVANVSYRTGCDNIHINFPSNLTAEQRATLQNVANRYCNLTPQQAMAMGYQPVGACIPNVGQMYVNQSMVDNVVDPMVPEAFAFDQRGKIVAVHYIVLANTPVALCGQQMVPSPVVQGAYQLPVWLYRTNNNGLFAMQNPDNKDLCPAPGVGY